MHLFTFLVRRTTKLAKPSKHIKMAFTCDDVVKGVYVNRRLFRVPKQMLDNWGQATLTSLPKGLRTLGIYCVNKVGHAGILASTNTGILTNGRWRCTNRVPLLSGGWVKSLI